MATTAAKPEVFSRKASGLSRVMSPWSAFMYNFLTMGVIFPWTFVWAPAAFPGVSVWKACLLAIFLELPIALAYVWMATAMPRSGGDYVFQSRVLGGAIGFPVVMSGFVIWILQWVALAGWLLATLGVAPLLMGLGVNWNNQSLIDAAVWVQSSIGVITVSVIGAALMAILLVTGFKNYVRLQYFMFAATGILMVILVVQFLRTNPAHFAHDINHFAYVVDGRQDYYQWLLKDVKGAGVRPAAEVRHRGDVPRHPDRVDEPAVGDVLGGAGRRDQGRPRLQEPDVHHRRLHDRHGLQPGAHRLGRGAGRGHRLLQRRVALLLLRGERVG